MRLRCLSGVLMVCGTGLLAGCPLGLDLSGLLDGSYSSGEMIADGSYTGAWESTTELWQGGERVWTGPNEGQLNVAFSDGAVLKANGDWLDVGDVEHLDMGTLQITREAYSIDYGDWGYEVAFDLTAEWKNAPMTGTQVVTYWLNADGSLDLYDTIELTSLDSYDGGYSYFWIESDGFLEPVGSGGSSRGGSGIRDPNGILDKKSGRIRR